MRLRKIRKVYAVELILLPMVEAQGEVKDGKWKPDGEWTTLIPVKDLISALGDVREGTNTSPATEAAATGSQEAGAWADASTESRQSLSAAIDGEADFSFKGGKRLRGRYHAALCFNGVMYSVTFRNMKASLAQSAAA